MQSDPLGIEAGFNTYAYMGNNPYRAVDPYGLMLEMLYYSYAMVFMPIKHEYGYFQILAIPMFFQNNMDK